MTFFRRVGGAWAVVGAAGRCRIHTPKGFESARAAIRFSPLPLHPPLPLSPRMPRTGRPFNQSFRNKVFKYLENSDTSEHKEFTLNDIRRAAKVAILELPFANDVYLRRLKFSLGWCRLLLSHLKKKRTSASASKTSYMNETAFTTSTSLRSNGE